MGRTSADINFLPEELQRYGRHLIMPEVGLEGQQKLKRSKVLVVGAGGLGSPLMLYLSAAGVGTIGVVDFDVVEPSNLQRQVLHRTEDVGKKKIDSASRRVQELNPHVSVRRHPVRLTSENALEIIREYDVVVDGTDNFPTRYLINDACVLLGKPNVYGSIFRFEGQASVFRTPDGPCYRCLYPEPPPPGLVPSCAEGGVLGVLPGLIGSVQATETLKLLLGIGDPLIGRLLLVDALKMTFREMKLRKDPACPICGEQPTISGLIDYEEFCGEKAVREKEQESELSVDQLRQKLKKGEDIVLLDVREPFEREIASIGGVLIPLGELPGRVHELDASKEIVVYCHTGVRSGRAVSLLRGMGFKKAKNLQGGIDRWSEQIDPTVPKY